MSARPPVLIKDEQVDALVVVMKLQLSKEEGPADTCHTRPTQGSPAMRTPIPFPRATAGASVANLK